MKKIAFWLCAVVSLSCGAQTSRPLASAMEAQGAATPATMAAPATRVMTSLEQFEAQLKLTPEQQGLWLAYQARLDAYTQQFYRERPVLPTAQEPAPAQVGRMVMNLQNRLASLEEIEMAAKNLFAALNPEQKLLANQALINTIPSLTSTASAVGAGETWRSDARPSGEMRRRGGGMGGNMGGGRGF